MNVRLNVLLSIETLLKSTSLVEKESLKAILPQIFTIIQRSVSDQDDLIKIQAAITISRFADFQPFRLEILAQECLKPFKNNQQEQLTSDTETALKDALSNLKSKIEWEKQPENSNLQEDINAVLLS